MFANIGKLKDFANIGKLNEQGTDFGVFQTEYVCVCVCVCVIKGFCQYWQIKGFLPILAN